MPTGLSVGIEIIRSPTSVQIKFWFRFLSCRTYSETIDHSIENTRLGVQNNSILADLSPTSYSWFLNRSTPPSKDVHLPGSSVTRFSFLRTFVIVVKCRQNLYLKLKSLLCFPNSKVSFCTTTHTSTLS